MLSVNECASQVAEEIVGKALAANETEISFASLRIEGLPASLARIGSLRSLSLAKCRQLTDLSPLAGLTGLQHLALSECDQLTDLSPLAGLTGLQDLDLRRCGQLTDLSPLAGLTGLQHLDLRRCGQLTDLSPLAGLTGLQHLYLSECGQLTDLSPLARLTGLQVLDLSGCRQFTDLSPLAGLTGLQHLALTGCRQFTDLSPLAGLTGLQHLALTGCRQFTDLRPLAGLTGLQHLYLSECGQLTDLSPLAGLIGLQDLDLGWCGQLTDLSPLAGLTGLQHLDLTACRQFTDLSPLAGLTGLQHLDLTACRQFTDLRPLARLTGLQDLDLSARHQLTDLSPLARLTGLQVLDLRACDQFTDLSPLARLTGLQHLDLRACDQLTDLSPLAGLTGLQHLDLTACRQLTDLSPLAGLTGLQDLALRECGQLTDLSPLAGLTGLQVLDLRGCRQFTDLSPLARLTGLQVLDLGWCGQLTDLSPLARLTGLQVLDLGWCGQLTDLSPLAGLTGLQDLALSECGQLTDLSPLAGLTGLQHLDLSECGQLTNFDSIRHLDFLEHLSCTGVAFPCIPSDSPINSLPRLQSLRATILKDAPQELTSTDNHTEIPGYDCLDRILAWQSDLLASGEAPNTELKVFVLGNGGVGKTQISRRLQGQPFDPEVPSTHGVSLGRLPLLTGDDGKPSLFANLWDFGGQDVYLGTHSLFLDERAVYLIVWTPGHENDRSIEENGIPMRNRPLGYWLEYVRSLAGHEAPVIVVQAQCDSESAVSEAPIPADHGFRRLQRTACSSLRSDGMERLLPELKAAGRLLQERHQSVRLPRSWVAVAERLREIRNDGKKTISWDEYLEICRKACSGALPDASIQYLHRSGQVFWRQGIFGNQVVLDQAWALDGMYAVLHRTTTLPVIRSQGGHFTPELLAALVWSNYSAEEQNLFLSMMIQCGTCFAVAPGHYVAPSLLPDADRTEKDRLLIWRDLEAEVSVRLDYSFLHEGIVRSVLCKVAEHAGMHGIYWNRGVCYYDGDARGPIEIRAQFPDASSRTGSGSIHIEGAGANALAIVRHLAESVRHIPIGNSPAVNWLKGEHDQRTSKDDSDPEREGDEPFSRIRPEEPPAPAGSKPIVHVSYAWGTQSDKIVDDLERKLQSHGYEVRRDKSVMRPGDWISTFMREIGRGGTVLIVLGERYPKSHYCMRELLYLYQSSFGEKLEMLSRIVPVILDDAAIDTHAARLQIVRYWREQREKLEHETRDLNPLCWGQSTRDQLLLIGDFETRSADMLAWLADVVMPRGNAEVGDFSAVLDIIRERNHIR